MYLPEDAIIYDNIIAALQSNIIKKEGNPAGWDESIFKSTIWNGKLLLRIGSGNQVNGNGLLINVPEGYTVLWVRVLNDRWETFRICPYDTTNTDIED